MSLTCSGTWTSCMAPPASTTCTTTPSIPSQAGIFLPPADRTRTPGTTTECLSQLVCCQILHDIDEQSRHDLKPDQTGFAGSPSQVPTPASANEEPGNKVEVGKPGWWLFDVGETRNRLSSNGGETRETTTAGCALDVQRHRRPLLETQGGVRLLFIMRAFLNTKYISGPLHCETTTPGCRRRPLLETQDFLPNNSFLN